MILIFDFSTVMRMRMLKRVAYKRRRATTCSFYLMLPAVALCNLVSAAAINVLLTPILLLKRFYFGQTHTLISDLTG